MQQTGMTGTLAVFLLVLSGVCFSVHTVEAVGKRSARNRDALTADAPPPPPGYSSREEIQKAILSGKLPIINLLLPVPDGVEVLTDIEYGRAGERSLQLDLYTPKKVKGDSRNRGVPALIFIHGGAWKTGKRTDYRFYCLKYAEKGYVCASITYRLTQQAPFPAAVQDAKCAVRWLRSHADDYGIDPKKIAAIGGSAGGHLAMMLGYTSGVAEFEGEGGHADASSAVQAVVDLYGPADLTTPRATSSRDVVKFLSGKTYEEAPELYRLASPLTHISKNVAPTLILHGTIDSIVPISQADTLARRLKEAGATCVYDRLEGWPHTMDLARPVNDRCQWFIDRFLARHLPFPRKKP